MPKEKKEVIKTIGPSGQISLGKQHAGKTVIIDELEPGVWQIKTAVIIPESEMWLWQEPYKSRLDAAVKWEEENDPRESTTSELAALEKKALARASRRQKRTA